MKGWLARAPYAVALSCIAATANAESEIGVRPLVEIVDLTALAISPDGTRIAFRAEQASLSRNRHLVTWYVAESGRPQSIRRLADGGVGIWEDPGRIQAEPPIWSPDGRSFYYRALIDDEIQIWRASIGGKAAERISGDAANVKSFTLGRDGTSIAYKVGATREQVLRAEQAEYDNGVLIDRTVDPGQNLFGSGYVDGRLAAQRLSGFWFDRRGLSANEPIIEKQLDLRDPSSPPAIIGKQTPKVAQIPDVATWDTKELQAVADDDRRASYRRQGDAVAVLKVSIPGQAEMECADEICRRGNIVAMSWQPDHRALLLTASDPAKRNALYRWDLALDKVRLLYKSDGTLDGGGVGGPTEPCAASGTDVFCVEAGPGMPPRLVQISLATGALTILADPNASLGLHENTAVETIEWRDEQDRQFTGQLFRPKTAPDRPLPLFVTYYNCAGYVRGGTGDEWPLDSLAQAGIVSLCINSAKTDMAKVADPAARFDLALSGVKSAIALLAKGGMVDPSRVGMGGLSFGSEVTFWVAMRSNLLRTISVASPQVTPIYYWFHGLPGRDNHENLKRAWGLGAPEKTVAQWRRISPAFAVEKLKLPILMQLPEHEFRSQLDLLSKLGEATSPAEMHVFPDETHIKIQPRHKLAAYQRNLDWFRFWLQDFEDSDPAKAPQYTRWHKLRLLQDKAAPSPLGSSEN